MPPAVPFPVPPAAAMSDPSPSPAPPRSLARRAGARAKRIAPEGKLKYLFPRTRSLARLLTGRAGLSHVEWLYLLTPPAVTGAAPAASVAATLAALKPVAVDGKPLVRLGPAGDGGYLVPDDLDGLAACYSPGVSSESGFEAECARRGMDVFLADASVDGPAEAHPRFHFQKKFVGATTGPGVTTLDDWAAETGHGARDGADGGPDLLLQMDIEGAEYPTLLAASPALMRRFRVIVLELHDLEFLFAAPFHRTFAAFAEKLLSTHVCVHVHPNNVVGSYRKGGLTVPRLAEFSFLRRDRVGGTAPVTALPHPLDAPNVPYRPDVALGDFWLGGPPG